MVKILKSGMYTSIQDTGRVGFRNLGEVKDFIVVIHA